MRFFTIGFFKKNFFAHRALTILLSFPKTVGPSPLSTTPRNELLSDINITFVKLIIEQYNNIFRFSLSILQ
jgi:hypothetical protein